MNTPSVPQITSLDCPTCGEALSNGGAESKGDGDIYDIWDCKNCGPTYEVHATYCQCGCGGRAIYNIQDPEWFPFDPY